MSRYQITIIDRSGFKQAIILLATNKGEVEQRITDRDRKVFKTITVEEVK